jgi:hypothetical protein
MLVELIDGKNGENNERKADTIHFVLNSGRWRLHKRLDNDVNLYQAVNVS